MTNIAVRIVRLFASFGSMTASPIDGRSERI
jgi:hypothetical protein